MRALPATDRVITALDVPSAEAALALTGRLGDRARFVKVGLELFSAGGPTVVQLLQGRGKRIFLDLKYADIPNTVAGAARVAAALGVSLVTMHASCGRAAIAAAAAALADAPENEMRLRPALLAVTVLTSLGPDDLAETAPGPDTIPARVSRLARLAWTAGCDGLVCSPTDLPAVRAELGGQPLVVTPGIRPPGADQADQKRIATPRAAFAAGADFLVVGRPITGAEDPAGAHAAIAAELEVRP
ncbi:MAG TPA: orotidine-5'-phosphate decarboxylase [Candidatus Krumholzibacteria bacterium]|nr:orotidine-5'-phosphate decarboxylase [Candidatus Krumholzibacteria bacterium]HPD72161.1 orotidine-5'-phosphate decarboxylase [Candidatus Krumholzibacteria bacterium]HRY40907.1 orotidine-5'-phosphate decarboxylase [Candidatus Krumholzibacteria bacterium]